MRKHLDFVATHNFDCSSDSKTLNEDIEGHVAEWSEPENFDIRERFDLHQWIRVAELLALSGGDMLAQRLRSGHVQGIEPDCIRDPESADGDWINGVKQNDAGKNTHFGVWKNKRGGGWEFDRILPANQVFHFGYFQRFNQGRGISPFAPGLDQLRQVANAVRYAQAKQIISAMVGLVSNVEDPKRGNVNLTGGPFMVEIGIDEKLDMLQDKTPSMEFDSFLKHVIGMSLKSIDLPYNFYDERYTNFFGSRAALNLYLMSCNSKRRRVRSLLNNLTRWQLNYRLSIGKLRLPRSMDLDTVIRKYCAWIPVGFQWWNPLQEAKAAEIMLKLRLKSRSELRRETEGDSWFGLQDQIDAEEKRVAETQAAEHDPAQPSPIDADDLAAAVLDQIKQNEDEGNAGNE